MNGESRPLTWWTSRRRPALPQGLAGRRRRARRARGRRSRKDPEVGQGAERPSPGQPRRLARGPPGLRRRPRDRRRDARPHHASSRPPGEARAGISRRPVLARGERLVGVDCKPWLPMGAGAPVTSGIPLLGHSPACPSGGSSAGTSGRTTACLWRARGSAALPMRFSMSRRSAGDAVIVMRAVRSHRRRSSALGLG
jgi:hypothetical protein